MITSRTRRVVLALAAAAIPPWLWGCNEPGTAPSSPPTESEAQITAEVVDWQLPLPDDSMYSVSAGVIDGRLWASRSAWSWEAGKAPTVRGWYDPSSTDPVVHVPSEPEDQGRSPGSSEGRWVTFYSPSLRTGVRLLLEWASMTRSYGPQDDSCRWTQVIDQELFTAPDGNTERPVLVQPAEAGAGKSEALQEVLEGVAILSACMPTERWDRLGVHTDTPQRENTSTIPHDAVYVHKGDAEPWHVPLTRSVKRRPGPVVAHHRDGELTHVGEEYLDPKDMPYVLFGRTAGSSLVSLTGPDQGPLRVETIFEPQTEGSELRLLTAYDFDPESGRAIYAVLGGHETRYDRRYWDTQEVYQWSAGESDLVLRFEEYDVAATVWPPMAAYWNHERYMPRPAIVWLQQVSDNEAWAFTAAGEFLTIYLH